MRLAIPEGLKSHGAPGSYLVQSDRALNGEFYAALAREVRASHQPIKPPCCLIAGGETTVTLRGPGAGGRCQELALAVLLAVASAAG